MAFFFEKLVSPTKIDFLANSRAVTLVALGWAKIIDNIHKLALFLSSMGSFIGIEMIVKKHKTADRKHDITCLSPYVFLTGIMEILANFIPKKKI